MELHQFVFRDETSTQLQVFPQTTATDLLLVLPAMGVRASYYIPLAKRLNEEGYAVVIADWRGNGTSSVRASWQNNFGYHALIEDVGEIVRYCTTRFPNQRISFFGHSLGGQIGGLVAAKYPQAIHRLILVASCTVYFRKWSLGGKIRVLFAAIVAPMLGQVLGYFPGKQMGFAGREARQVMRDWAYNAFTGNYVIAQDDFDYDSALTALSIPILAISFANDHLAERAAVAHLVSKFSPTTSQEHWHIEADEVAANGFNHFRWVKKPDIIVNKLKAW